MWDLMEGAEEEKLATDILEEYDKKEEDEAKKKKKKTRFCAIL